MDIAGLLDDMKERVRTQGATPFVGGGMRGAFLRGLLGLDPAEESTQAQVRAYQTGQALSNSPTPLALAAAPAAIAKAGKAAKAKKPLPREEALETARKNAVEMLGLPESNTAMDRARAMGFNTDAFHATDYDITKLDKSFLGSNTAAKSAKQGFFSAGHPRTTYAYVDKGVTGADAIMSLLYGKSSNQLEKELLEYATSKNLKPYQVRDEFYENLPNKHIQSLQALTNARASILKEIPGVKLMGRHVPNMNSASQKQIKALDSINDAIEEQHALANMVFREQNTINELDDIADVAVNNLLSGANIMPLKINTSNANVYDDLNAGFRQDTFANRMAETIKNSKDLAIIQNTQDGFKKSDTIYGVINPSIVRSRFAAFDPKRINDPDLLASLAAFGVGLPVLGLLAEEE